MLAKLIKWVEAIESQQSRLSLEEVLEVLEKEKRESGIDIADYTYGVYENDKCIANGRIEGHRRSDG